ncbi:MAG: hypothetical protein ABSA78_22105 [Candidatus Sulfotelmatobacter sp.]|jgi:hypothetical protein
MLNLLKRFVASRFLLLPAFCSVYYFQLGVVSSWPLVRSICLLVLIVILLLAIPANWLWIVDFRKRLESGFQYLNSQPSQFAEPDEPLEQMRWCNVQILGIVVMILGILSQYQYVERIPRQHRVPALALVLLILIALFDAIMDLQAEWIISVMTAIKGSEQGKLAFPKAVWKVNQYPKVREKLYSYAVDSKPSTMGFSSFTASAQNTISFAMIIVSGFAATIIALLWLQLRSIPGNLIDWVTQMCR